MNGQWGISFPGNRKNKIDEIFLFEWNAAKSGLLWLSLKAKLSSSIYSILPRWIERYFSFSNMTSVALILGDRSTLDAVQKHHSNYYICNRKSFSWTNVWDHLALWLQTETNEIPLFSTSPTMSVISLSVPGYLSHRETESNKESDTGTQEEHRSPGTQVSRINGRKTDKGRKWKVQLDPQGQNQQNKPGNNWTKKSNHWQWYRNIVLQRDALPLYKDHSKVMKLDSPNSHTLDLKLDPSSSYIETEIYVYLYRKSTLNNWTPAWYHSPQRLNKSSISHFNLGW